MSENIEFVILRGFRHTESGHYIRGECIYMGYYPEEGQFQSDDGTLVFTPEEIRKGHLLKPKDKKAFNALVSDHRGASSNKGGATLVTSEELSEKFEVVCLDIYVGLDFHTSKTFEHLLMSEENGYFLISDEDISSIHLKVRYKATAEGESITMFFGSIEEVLNEVGIHGEDYHLKVALVSCTSKDNYLKSEATSRYGIDLKVEGFVVS